MSNSSLPVMKMKDLNVPNQNYKNENVLTKKESLTLTSRHNSLSTLSTYEPVKPIDPFKI